MQTQNFELSVTFKGATVQELITQAQGMIDSMETKGSSKTTTATPPKKAARRSAHIEDETDSLLADSDETETEVLGFDDEPAPKAKKTKAPKFTDKDVNNAAIAHAKANGRKATMAILSKQFKIKSILELEPDQYAEVIEALEV